jgi:hypothetical protein
MFGGQDEKGKLYNDLWFITPFYHWNQKLLSTSQFEYVHEKPALCLTLKQITEFSGKAPCPRTNATSTIIQDNDKTHYMVVYGGRNDQIYGDTGNIGLNDINLFNTKTLTWTALAFYGIQPCSRWAHIMIPNRADQPDGF